MISAGPGYGKTLSLADWVRGGDVPGPVAWLSVDTADDSVPGFWSSLLVAIRACGVVPAGDELLDVAPAASFSVGDVADVVTALDRLATPLVIVLDDLQHLRDRDVLDSINALIARLPARVRLVLSSRYDPPLRLRRAAIAGAVTEIRSQDLAFTAAEAEELLRAVGLDLPAGAVDMLVARTRGWAAGLRLAAMGLDREAPEDAIARLAGSDRAVAEYLTEEVLDQLSDVDRGFLLTAGVADPITAELAEVLTVLRTPKRGSSCWSPATRSSSAWPVIAFGSPGTRCSGSCCDGDWRSSGPGPPVTCTAGPQRGSPVGATTSRPSNI